MNGARRGLGVALGAAACGAWAASGRDAVVVLGTTDRAQAQPLIDDFERRHPALAVDYQECGSLEATQRFLADAATPRPRVDIVWSSAMDLQVKLVNDGHALRHASVHTAALPRWAVWKNEAFGTTFEPLALAWHRDEGAPPATRAELQRLLAEKALAWRGRVCTYDVSRAGLGYLMAAHEADASPAYWSLVRALGDARAQLFDNTAAMLERVATRQAVLAYHVLGTYAQSFAARHPQLQVAYFRDFTFVVSRVAFIARRSPRPAAARLWLDHMLSREGQAVLAERSGLYALREDIAAPRTALALRRELGASVRPVALAPGLMAYLDQSRRAAFVQLWRREFEHGK